MKRFFNVFLIVLAGLFAFVACSPQAGFSDELVNVSIEGSSQKTGRALIVETDFDISKVKVWKYTAAKADGGLDTGATTEQVALVKDESGNWMTKSLSQGSWNFVLYGYSDEGGSTLVCSGSVDNQTITVANHNVKITVRPSQTATGKIVIEDDIKIVKKDGTEYSGTEYTKTVTVTNAAGTDVTSQISSNVASGRYKVEVVFKGTANGEEYTAAKAFKYINVYDNLTTTVSGTIEEIEQAGNVDPEGGMINAEAKVTVTVEEQKNKEAVEIAVASTPAGTTDEKKTTVKFPAKSVSMGTSSTELTLKVESSSIQAASTSYTVETEEGAPVAGFKFTLEGAESTTFDTDDGVEVETYIETGLGEVSNIKIKYIGSSDGKAPEIVSYDSSTGKLVFKVYHFSTYVIIAENVAAVDNNGKIYTTLKEALISDASEITVFQNSELTEAVTIGSDKIINLNEKTINLNVTGDAINLSASDKAYTVEFIDGKITGKASNICFTVSNNGTLVLRNMDMKTTCLAGIFLVQGACPANLEVIDSVIDVTGGYGIGTNASETNPATYVEITIDNSSVTVKSSNQDNTALFVNVDAKLSVTDSTISGQRQGAMLRGTGTNEVTIANSTIEATGNGSYTDRSTTWSSGNEVALAALVIGNSPNTNAGYERPTTVKLDNVTLNIADDYKGKHIWVVQQSDDYIVKVSGDINGDWTVNENINGAEYPLAKIGEKYYSTLHSAVLAAQTGETVTLLCDASGSGLESKDASGNAVGARGDITIDFGGHTYTVTNTSVGSTGTETQAMHWGRSIKSITMKNGKFTTTQFDTLKMGMQNYVDFTAENMTFDMSNVLVVEFGENKFSGNDAIYNGKEVAIFNNNKGAMKLTNCTVMLPESSEMGMSADGDSVTLVGTTVNGAVNMQDSTSKLIKDSSSKITKGVVAYFSETYDIAETTTDGSTTYTLKAKSTN